MSLPEVLEYALDYTLNNKDPERRKLRRDKRRKKVTARPDEQAVSGENNKKRQSNETARPDEQATSEGIHSNHQSEAAFSGMGRDLETRRKSGAPERFIPRKTRDETFERAGYRCEYLGPTGRRCSARSNLHIDHKKPLAFGGGSDAA